jgi:hypothetical protein
MTTELIVDFAIDLYLHLISISRRFVHDSVTLGAILLYWLPLLALSWLHDDEAIRREGALWVSDIASAAPARMCSPILDSLGLIISPRHGEGSFRLIPSAFFSTGQDRTGPMPRGWVPSGPGLTKCTYDHGLMKSKALSFANLPTKYFDTAQEGLTAQKHEQHSLPFPPAISTPLPDQDTVVAYGLVLEDAKSRIFHESLVRYDISVGSPLFI